MNGTSILVKHWEKLILVASILLCVTISGGSILEAWSVSATVERGSEMSASVSQALTSFSPQASGGTSLEIADSVTSLWRKPRPGAVTPCEWSFDPMPPGPPPPPPQRERRPVLQCPLIYQGDVTAGLDGVSLRWTLETIIGEDKRPALIAGFNVYRDVKGNGEAVLLTPRALAPSVMSFSDATVDHNITYEYAVESVAGEPVDGPRAKLSKSVWASIPEKVRINIHAMGSSVERTVVGLDAELYHDREWLKGRGWFGEGDRILCGKLDTGYTLKGIRKTIFVENGIPRDVIEVDYIDHHGHLRTARCAR